MDRITYQVEVFSEIKAELEPFIEPHWAELGLDHQDVPVDLDWGKYAAMDEVGDLHTVTVRDDGKLIGYHVSLVKTGLHYASTLHAFVDLYYLKPEYRKGKVGLGLFQYAEMSLHNLGVVKIVNGSKLHLFHDKLFIGLGYKPTEVLFTKIISHKETSNV